MTKTALITGCTSGIGEETALALASKGFNLILVSRNMQKLQQLDRKLKAINPNILTAAYPCDFADLQAVAQTATQIAQAHPELDILINNAGTWERQKTITSAGFELTWTVNYFAPFIFTQRLLPSLQARAALTHDVRIIIVGSEAHRGRQIDFSFTGYGLQTTYGATKLADMLYSFKLARLLGTDSGITVNTLHPGVVATGLWRQIPNPLRWAFNKMLITPAAGAQTTVYLATLPELTDTGKYYSHSQLAQPSATAGDMALQDQLYAVTIQKLSTYL